MIEIKPKCFAFRDDIQIGMYCSVLNLKVLNCHNCHFFKTKEDYEKMIERMENKNG